VSTDPSSAPLASFEAKWTQAYPEFGLALKFDRDHGRDERKAFACLVFELEHAAFGIREAQPAAIKLQWWAEEFARTGAGEARHPLTKSLAARIGEAAIPLRRWQEAIVGAFAQRDAEPFANITALLDGYARFYEPR
jgi:phytoene/squalene synthetase